MTATPTIDDTSTETFDSAASKKAWLKRARKSDRAKAAREGITRDLSHAKRPGDERAKVLDTLSSRKEAHSDFGHYRVDKNGTKDYSPERKAQQDKVIDAWFKANEGTPNDGKAIMLGGLPGSGKGGSDLAKGDTKYATLDPDDIKARMLSSGMVTRVPGLSDGEHAALIHTESGDITDRILDRAVKQRMNVVLDKTMLSSPTGTISALRADGYNNVRGVYVDVQVAESERSALTRWKDGGRYVPRSYIHSSLTPSGEARNKQSFREAAEQFDDWTVIDNTGIENRKPAATRITGKGKATFTGRFLTFVTTDLGDLTLGWFDDQELLDDLSYSLDIADDIGFVTDTLCLDDHTAWDLEVHAVTVFDTLTGQEHRILPTGYMPDLLTEPHEPTGEEFAALVAAALEEFAVPRDRIGRWTSGGSTGDAHGLAVRRADKVTAGQSVTVQPGELAGLVTELGARPDVSDLTAVSTVGYPNLFAGARMNRSSRDDMPQIPTAHLDDFRASLDARGIGSRLVEVDPADLTATQNELNAKKVAGMMHVMNTGQMVGSDHPVWVSSDGKVLDGHHRWAAEAVMSVSVAPRRMTVMKVDAPMSKLLPLAKAYSRDEGIESKSIAAALVQAMEGFDLGGRRQCWSREAGIETFDSAAAKKAWETRKRKAAEAGGDATGSAENGLPGKAQLATMEHVPGPLGSQGGGWYKDKSGQKYLVKPAQSRDHAMNELAASVVYAHAGVNVDRTGVYQDGGKWYIVKKAIQSDDGKLGQQVGPSVPKALQMEARKGAAVDMLTSTWDVHGLNGDNMVTANGELHRIDVGGSLAYRAMGGKRDSWQVGAKWVEPDTMRTSNQGKALYGNMTNAETADLLAGLSSFDIAGTDKALRKAGVDGPVRERTVAVIEDRVKNQLPGIIERLRSDG